ncbi:hypothetical protein FRX31_015115 [Thalictrum thalictroides]|uniref:Uncharacterized protein n=1 Tax=Thalictrum thalictroides TaxID=46969 RepID=A0A7J6WEL1_THATH|nr:hypothetical protein FRX31_015115 [Thalictrum thalictroides]
MGSEEASLMSNLSSLDDLPSYSQDQLWAEIDIEEETHSIDLPSVTFLLSSSSYALLVASEGVSYISEVQVTSVMSTLSSLDEFPSYSQDQLWAEIDIEEETHSFDFPSVTFLLSSYALIMGSVGASHISEIQVPSIMSNLSSLDELPSYSQDQLWAEIDIEEETPSFDFPSVTFLSSSYSSPVETESSSTSTNWELEELIDFPMEESQFQSMLNHDIPALMIDDYQLDTMHF